MTDDNIVLFPKMKSVNPPQTLSDVRASIAANREMFMGEVAENLSNFVLVEMQNTGFEIDTEDPGVRASVTMLYEAIRAAFMRLDAMDHPLHEVADDMYSTEEDLDIEA